MGSCCDDRCEISVMRRSHGRVLWVVLVINTLMFLVETYAGLLANSTALIADALDMLGDALTYGFSLFVLGRSARWEATAALVKGSLMLAVGLSVLGEAVYHVFSAAMPNVETMRLVGALALIANAVCFFLLYRHRTDNLNMSSTWLCSRNDLIANIGVLLAAGAGHILVSRWPDIVVGVVIACLFLRSAQYVLMRAWRAWEAPAGGAAMQESGSDTVSATSRSSD